MDFRTNKKPKPKATFEQYCKIILKACAGIAFINPSAEINTVIKVVEGLQKVSEEKKKEEWK